MSSKYIATLLIVLSILASIIVGIGQYGDDMQKGRVGASDLWSYGISIWQVFCATQMFFLSMGSLGNKIIYKRKMDNPPYVIYPLSQKLVITNICLSSILCIVFTWLYTESTGYIDMAWADHFSDPLFLLLIYVWFAVPYVTLFYAEIISIWILRLTKKAIGSLVYKVAS